MTKEGYSNGEKLPSHLIVPCIRFVVSKKFHFLGSLFFHEEFLKNKPDKFGKDISECIKLYILALQNINLQVVATVCPLTATFHQAVVILTDIPYLEDYDGPLFYNVGKNEEIMHFHDPKYIRNSFIRWFMLFDLEFTLSGQRFEASKYDITEGLSYENKPLLLQKSYSNNKFYDHISSYYFSNKMSMTIRKLIKHGVLGKQAIGTSLFINMFRQVFNRLYGLNNEGFDKFDFERVNEYIDFITSVRATQHPHEENNEDDVYFNLPSTSTSESKSGLTTIEKCIKDTPRTSRALYTQPGKPLDTIKEDTKFEPVTFPKSSSETIPSTSSAPSQTGSKKKKKKKVKKKQNQCSESSTQFNKGNKVKDDKGNVKDELLLLYQKPSQDVKDNGEFVLCTTEKYQEIQAQNALSSDHSYALPYEENDELDRNFWMHEMLQSDTSNQPQKTNVIPNNKLHQKYDKKVLSPVQNQIEINVNKNIDQSIVRNSNLNENIRKYKNVNKTNSSAVRKISLDDESNKENITKNFCSSTFEDTLDIITKKTEALKLDVEPSYSISDPDDSTEYQFEQMNTVKNKIDDISESKREQTLKEPPFMSDNICKLAVDILHSYLTKDQVRALLVPESALENAERFKSLMDYLKNHGSQNDEIVNDETELTEPLREDFKANNIETYKQKSIQGSSQIDQNQSVTEEIKLQLEMNIPQLDNPTDNVGINLIKINPNDINMTSVETGEKSNIKIINSDPLQESFTSIDVDANDIKAISLKPGVKNILQFDNIQSGTIKMHIIKSGTDGFNDERIDIKLVSTDCAQQPTVDICNDDKQNKSVSAEGSLSSVYSQLNANMDSLKIKIENKCDQDIDNKCLEQPMLDSLPYSEPRQSVDDKGNLTPQLNTVESDNVPSDNAKMNLVKISHSGIERASGDISEYDPLKINKNTYITGTKSSKNVIDISYLKQDDYSAAEKLQPLINSGPSKNIESSTSEFNIEGQRFSDISSYYPGNISDTLVEDFPYSNNMELLADTSVNLASYAKVLNAGSNNPGKTCSFQTIETRNTKNINTYGELYPQYQKALNSSTGDIIAKLDLYPDYNIEDAEAQPRVSTEQSDKCTLSDFNSEYDDFDEIIMNKQVTRIINNLEEKDAQTANIEQQTDLFSVAPSTSKEQLPKKKFVKREISYPVSESGVVKKTIFHRDKTEEYIATPKNVIKNSDNITDKSKVTSTKASYSKTLGLKKKKQLERMREEQYKKVANTISQTIRTFSDIFNLPDSNEEKYLRISRASLEFVYDLKNVNKNTDVKMKQKLVEAAYHKLCLSILGNNIDNPEAHQKMRELMPILQEIATPAQDNSDDASSKSLSAYISKASFSKEIPKGNSQIGETNYVREDVPNLWSNNIRGMEMLFRRLGGEKVHFELSPELFKTEHVVQMMNFIQVNGPAIESFPLDQECLPINLPECFDTLKPYGSVLLVED
ncbi:hypothetical protein WA026_008099 [Henosepilachna vigintioctopunctata]